MARTDTFSRLRALQLRIVQRDALRYAAQAAERAEYFAGVAERCETADNALGVVSALSECAALREKAREWRAVAASVRRDERKVR